jgi:hypothetical protein
MKEEIYQEFLKSYKEKHKDFKGFTRTQYNFIMWLIENQKQITQLGDLDDLFKSVRHFLKQ